MGSRFLSAATFDRTRPAAVTAVVMGAAWLIKYALIMRNGGPLPDEGFWIPFTYFVGLLTLFAAGALAAWRLLHGRPAWLRAVAALVGAVLAFLLHRALHAIGTAVYTTPGWHRDELSILLTALVVLAAGIVGLLLDRVVEATPTPGSTT